MKYSETPQSESHASTGRLLIIDDDDVLLSALPWPISLCFPLPQPRNQLSTS